MKILVQKFGGTSVANLECMKKVREKVQAGLNKGYKMVVVLSARSGETNRLLALASEWSSTPDPAECDSLVSTGEQVSIALFTMLLKDAGIRARSLLAWQIPIITDDDHGNARIESIDSQRLRSYLDEYDVLVVAGFQGCTESQRITTLGRGGSDTSAVALAAALGSVECEIYTDVDGVCSVLQDIFCQGRQVCTISRVRFQHILKECNEQIFFIFVKRLRVATRDQSHIVVKQRRQPQQLSGVCIAQKPKVGGMPVGVCSNGIEENHAYIVRNGCRTDLLQRREHSFVIIVIAHEAAGML